MMPFGKWSWRLKITRAAFKDAWQSQAMVFTVGQSVDARAGGAIPVRESDSHSEKARRHDTAHGPHDVLSRRSATRLPPLGSP